MQENLQNLTLGRNRFDSQTFRNVSLVSAIKLFEGIGSTKTNTHYTAEYCNREP